MRSSWTANLPEDLFGDYLMTAPVKQTTVPTGDRNYLREVHCGHFSDTHIEP